MEGTLRTDLFQEMLEWEQRTDLTLALGTSMCGMNSDRVFKTVSKRGKDRREGYLGGVIISLQQTIYDDISCLRIFGKLDRVMGMLAEQLNLTQLCMPRSVSLVAGDHVVSEDVFRVKYDQTGHVLGEGEGEEEDRFSLLDLQAGARIRLVSGPYAGDEGEVLGRNREGHYRLQFMHRVGAAGTKRPFERVMGKWWVEAAVAGSVPAIPITNC
jgi:hypothetical protein